MPACTAEGGSRALDEHVRLGECSVVGAMNASGAERHRGRQSLLGDVGDGDVAAAESARDLQREQTDGARSGHEHAHPGADTRLAARPIRHRERFEQGARDRAHRVGQRRDEVCRHRHVLDERAVDGRRREKAHVGAQVVGAAAALLAGTARDARLDAHARSEELRRGSCPDLDDGASGLVAENERLLDDELADSAVAVVVNVGAADADRLDSHEHVVGSRCRHLALLDDDVAGGAQYARAHRGGSAHGAVTLL